MPSNVAWASVHECTLSVQTSTQDVRTLIALSVGAPVVVAGAVILLVASALVGSWLWGAAVAVCFVVLYLVGVALVVRWGRSRPDQAQGFLTNWGRAMAFGSGGWEKSSEEKRNRRT
jgi:hypothetical protein